MISKWNLSDAPLNAQVSVIAVSARARRREISLVVVDTEGGKYDGREEGKEGRGRDRWKRQGGRKGRGR